MPDARDALFAQAAAIARARLLMDRPPLPDIVCVHRVRLELHCINCQMNGNYIDDSLSLT